MSAHVSHPLPALRRVDLSHNHFLSYCDAPWELLLLHTLTAGDSGDSGKCGKEAASCEDNDDGSEPMDLDLNGVGGGFLPSSTATQTLRNSADPFEQFAIELFVQCVSLDSVDLSHCATSEKQAHYLCEGLVQAVKARASKGHSAVRNIVLSGFDTEFPGIIDSLKNALADIGFANTVDCSGVNLCI